MSKLNPKIVISVFVALILIFALVAVGPVLWALINGPGVKTEPLDASKAKPAETEIDGEWEIEQGRPPNTSSVGFTFEELLPSDARVTSGSTTEVSGGVTIEAGTLTAGEVIVDMTEITSDRDVRDVNVRNKLFETDQFPESTFKITKAVDVSHLPDDGTVGEVEITGDLTIKGETKEITDKFQAVRDGERLIVSGSPVIDRNEFGVESPEFIAAEIADEGELNIRLSMSKK